MVILAANHSSVFYLLSEDIWNAGNLAVGACIRITSNDVVLDGADHFL